MNIPSNLPIPSHPTHGILDSTKIQCYQDCPRKFFYKYTLGLNNARPNNHLRFGAAVHKALEYLIVHGYTADSIIESMNIFTRDYREEFPEETDEIYSPKTPDRFLELLIQYVKKYSSDHMDFSVFKTEFGGTIHLSESHEVAFKMDTILQDNLTGNYFSLEHKTTQANYLSQSFVDNFKLSTQVGTYTHVLHCLFPPEEVTGVTINCLCFKKTKKPSFILERFPTNLSNSNMYVWLETTKNWLDKIEVDFQALSFEDSNSPLMKSFPLNTRACTNYKRLCSYYDLCLNWQNPLRHLENLPVDMCITFWNPLEEDLNEVLTL